MPPAPGETAAPVLVAYNPGLLDDRQVEALFTARKPLLSRILDDLAASVARGAPQHHLFVGPRGMGKTMLLRRLRTAIRADERLAHCVPISFPEELYAVHEESGFWLACLEALADTLQGAGQGEAAGDVDAIIDTVPAQEERRREAARDALVGWAERESRLLVLLLDNVDLVFERLSDRLWPLRETFSEERRLVLLAAAADTPSAVHEYGSPFYDFLAVHELRPLDPTASLELLDALGEATGRGDAIRRLRDDPGRFRTLQLLTGGNPRTLVQLFEVVCLDAVADVMDELQRLVDRCTPLYKARFEALAEQAQVVLHTLALEWDPCTAARLAERSRVEVTSVSTQLLRLRQLGLVEQVEVPGEARAAFQVAERLFNVWYLMRAGRRARQRLFGLLEFVRLFFGGARLAEVGRGLLRDLARGSSEDARRAEWALALSQSMSDRTLRAALEVRGLRAVLDSVHGVRERLVGRVDVDGDDRDLAPTLDRMEAIREIRRLLEPLREELGTETLDDLAAMVMSPPDIPWAERVAAARALGARDPSVGEPRQDLCEAVSSARRLFGDAAWRRWREAFFGGFLDHVRDVDGADAADVEDEGSAAGTIARWFRSTAESTVPWGAADCREWVLAHPDPRLSAWILSACAMGALQAGDGDRALEALRRAAERFPAWDGAAWSLAWHLAFERDDRSGALEVLSAHLGTNPGSAWSLSLRSLLRLRSGDGPGAIEDARAATAAGVGASGCPTVGHWLFALVQWGIELESRLEGISSVVETVAAALREPDTHASAALGLLRLRMGRPAGEWLPSLRVSADAEGSPTVVLAALGMALVLDGEDTEEACGLLRRAQQRGALEGNVLLALAAATMEAEGWMQAASLLPGCAEALRAGGHTSFLLLSRLARAASDSGHAGDLARFLKDSALAERYEPIHAALLADEEGSAAGLFRLAPEIRAPALDLFQRYRPDLPTDIAALRPKKRPAPRRRRRIP